MTVVFFLSENTFWAWLQETREEKRKRIVEELFKCRSFWRTEKEADFVPENCVPLFRAEVILITDM